ncbi:MAG: hypothetical protein AABY87_00260 [bacterium]
MWKSIVLLWVILSSMSLNGCVGLNTFPKSARAGDTITIGVGNAYLHGGETENMTRTNTMVMIYDGGSINYSLTPRATLNLFPDSRSKLVNYNLWMTTPSLDGRPYETVMVVDLPTDIPVGSYTVEVVSSVAGLVQPYISNLNIVGTGGSPDSFLDEFGLAENVKELETAPFSEVTLSSSAVPVGAVQLDIGFDNTIVSSSNIRVVQAQFDRVEKQNNLFWRVEPGIIHVYILSPEGVSQTKYLKLYLVRPQGSGDPLFNVLPGAKIVDVDGNPISGMTASITSMN